MKKYTLSISCFVLILIFSLSLYLIVWIILECFSTNISCLFESSSSIQTQTFEKWIHFYLLYLSVSFRFTSTHLQTPILSVLVRPAVSMETRSSFKFIHEHKNISYPVCYANYLPLSVDIHFFPFSCDKIDLIIINCSNHVALKFAILLLYLLFTTNLCLFLRTIFCPREMSHLSSRQIEEFFISSSTFESIFVPKS